MYFSVQPPSWMQPAYQRPGGSFDSEMESLVCHLNLQSHSEELNLLRGCFWTIWVTHTFRSAHTQAHPCIFIHPPPSLEVYQAPPWYAPPWDKENIWCGAADNPVLHPASVCCMDRTHIVFAAAKSHWTALRRWRTLALVYSLIVCLKEGHGWVPPR